MPRSRYTLLPLLLLGSLVPTISAAAETSIITTQPSLIDVESLRARIKALQLENDLLRSELRTLNKPLPPPTTQDDRPLQGIEGLLLEAPQNELPGGDSGTNALRQSLFTKWIQNHAIGRTITLSGAFMTAGAIDNGTFPVQITSLARTPHPFTLTLNMPELEAPTIIDLKTGMPLRVTGQISSLDFSVNNGTLSFRITLSHASFTAFTR